MTYQLYLEKGLPANGVARHNDDGSISFIPNDPLNRDWIAYQAWAAIPGNVVAPASPPSPPTPEQLELEHQKALVIDLALPLSQRFAALIKLLGYVA